MKRLVSVALAALVAVGCGGELKNQAEEPQKIPERFEVLEQNELARKLHIYDAVILSDEIAHEQFLLLRNDARLTVIKLVATTTYGVLR